MPSNDHISSRFDSELDEIIYAVQQMAALVQEQTRGALDALVSGEVSRMDVIIENDDRVNQMEIRIDDISVRVVARRQPTARDLRLLIAVGKTVTDLERIGDEAQKIARMGKLLAAEGGAKLPLFHEITQAGELAVMMLNTAMLAFAGQDMGLATQAMNCDDQVDERYRVVMRKLVTCMMEDPRAISKALSMLDAVKSIERIGDHAHNIAQYVIYMVKGQDVRHLSNEQIKNSLS